MTVIVEQETEEAIKLGLMILTEEEAGEEANWDIKIHTVGKLVDVKTKCGTEMPTVGKQVGVKIKLDLEILMVEVVDEKVNTDLKILTEEKMDENDNMVLEILMEVKVKAEKANQNLKIPTVLITLEN